MANVFCDTTMSLDGFIAGPNPTLEEPLGEGGMQLHEWVLPLASFRERHGESGGEVGTADDDVMRESLEVQGAIVMGRRMFRGGEGPWEDDPNADGWWLLGDGTRLLDGLRPARLRLDRVVASPMVTHLRYRRT